MKISSWRAGSEIDMLNFAVGGKRGQGNSEICKIF